MPQQSTQDQKSLQTHLKFGAYGLAIRGGTTFLYANLGDTLRTVSQTQNISSGQVWSQAVASKGYIHGTLDLHFRGMAPNLLRVSSREATRAFTMSYIESIGIVNEFAKAAFMTSVDVIASIPDTIKVLQQSNAEYRNRWIYPLSYYTKGFVPTAVRQGFRWGAVYLIKPQISLVLKNNSQDTGFSSFQLNIFANFLSATLASFMVLPFDAVKSRIQNNQATGNYLKTVRDMISKEGPKALLRGGVPKWFITVNAIMNSLLVQDLIKSQTEVKAAPGHAFGIFNKQNKPDSAADEDNNRPSCGR